MSLSDEHKVGADGIAWVLPTDPPEDDELGCWADRSGPNPVPPP